ISYSHDSADHEERVLGLSERLRTDGFEAQIDQYVAGRLKEDWSRWMLDQLDWADSVLLVCTETYYRRFRGHETPDVGFGVDWEGNLITNAIYQARSRTRKFVPILFTATDAQFIPEPLQGKDRFLLDSETAYESLKSHLTGRSGVEPGELGEIVIQPRKTGKPLTFPQSSPGISSDSLTADSRTSSPLSSSTPSGIHIGSIDLSGAQGAIVAPTGPVHQTFGPMINTGGGAYVGGSIETGGGKFVAGDDQSQTTWATPKQFAALLQALRQNLAEAKLDPDSHVEIERDLTSLESQAAKPEPRLSVIAARLGSVKSILESGAGIGTAAIGLAQLVQRGLEMAQQLFR
ncbi:MAG TPA: hypothetical protein DCE44_23685, partial [Verrucomicrobiales bacterium]|nr:hypothetical protein [Verrucomicrobiales bacterium]